MRHPRLSFGEVTAHLLRRGDSYPCPTKGHPPFVHDRAEPAVVLYRAGKVLRVLAVNQLEVADPTMFRGSPGPKPGFWRLSDKEVQKLVKWAKAQAAVEPKATRAKKVKAKKPVGPGFSPDPEAVRLRRYAHVHPGSTRHLLQDIDYLGKLSPQDRAFLDQFDSETSLNRWRDKEGVAPMYPRGSEGRRELQFQYNRRVDDLYTHGDWRKKETRVPAGMSDEGVRGVHHGQRMGYLTDPFDVIPSNALTEDELIEAIDARADSED